MNHKSPPTSAQRTASSLRSVALLSGLGLGTGASIAVGAMGGNWLDDRLGTTPWFLIVGFLLGAVAGFMHLFRLLAQLSPSKNS